IGSLASAGCVRMYNKDVEELYTQVPANTPVSIVYDRVSVVADDYINKKAVVIYPDCYNQDNKYRNTYIGKIDNADLPQLVKDKAKKLLTSKISKPVAVSEGMGVFLNNCFITCDAFLENGDIYINCFAAKDFLGLSAELAGLYSIDVKEVEDRIYVDFTQVMECYGGKLSYDKKTSNVYANVSIVKVNGVFIGKNYGDFDKESLIDVKSFEKLGYKHDEDSIDIGLFDKHIMKVLRKSQSCVSTDNIELALGGWEQRDSLRKTVDICVPPCIKVGDEYYTTHYVDNRPVLDAETASVVRERTGIAFEAFDNGSIQDDKVIDLEAFLTGLKYTSNEFYTVIELSKQENEVGIELIP
ncbi:MAG: L,D-transpeptidase, partial [Caulobacteraceae bacterium]